jgi:hypothetical protein
VRNFPPTLSRRKKFSELFGQASGRKLLGVEMCHRKVLKALLFEENFLDEIKMSAAV